MTSPSQRFRFGPYCNAVSVEVLAPDRLPGTDGAVGFDARSDPSIWSRGTMRRRVEHIAEAVVKDALPKLTRHFRALGGDGLESHPASERAQSRHTEIALAVRVELLRVLLSGDHEVALKVLTDAIGSGLGVDTVFSSLIPMVARELGDCWTQDCCSFVDVTIATGLLHRIVIDLSPRFQKVCPSLCSGRKILLNVTPGESHRLGLAIVSEYLQRAGWGVVRPGAQSAEEIVSAARVERAHIIGLSIGSLDSLASLRHTIGTIRRELLPHGRFAIMVGGPLFLLDPALARGLGADAVCTDGQETVLRADALYASVKAST